MGGLSRKSTYIQSLKADGIDPIILDGGEALFSSLIITKAILKSEQYKAESFLHEFEQIGCDVINIGGFDLAGGYAFLKALSEQSSISFLSANIKEVDGGQYPFEPYKIIERNGLQVGVIGVTNLVPASIHELEMDNFIETGKKYISQIKNDVDIVIVLVNAERSQENRILNEFKDADYVIQSRPLSRTSPTRKQKTAKPILFKMGKEAKYLTVISLDYSNPSRGIIDVTYPKYRSSFITRQLDQYQSKDPDKKFEELYGFQPTLLRQIQIYESERDSLEAFIDGAENVSNFTNVGMYKSAAYDTTMQNRIDNYLSTADSMRTAALLYSRHSK